ncbi:hypothetical protein F7725_015948 [Dissostichus mawsoni]|uniref:Uncharacterized protein n=1 Tax=Dissostichus mawsoni TaxID=36200 RepID=A0A7J5Y3F7_DISMA|nr:hypothetical protein F7725_015948 [Dissostichus mawsoni]
MMPSISVTQVFLLLALLHFATSLPVRDEDELESFLTQSRPLNAPWSLSGMSSADSLLDARLRQMLSVGLDRRRQLGDIEFSNRYAEFLRSKAKHSSRGGGGRGEGEPAAETVHVSVRLQQLVR